MSRPGTSTSDDYVFKVPTNPKNTSKLEHSKSGPTLKISRHKKLKVQNKNTSAHKPALRPLAQKAKAKQNSQKSPSIQDEPPVLASSSNSRSQLSSKTRSKNANIISATKEGTTKSSSVVSESQLEIDVRNVVEEDIERGLDLEFYSSLNPLLRDTISLKTYKSFWKGNKKFETVIPQRPPPPKSITNPNEKTKYYIEQYFQNKEKVRSTNVKSNIPGDESGDDEDDSEHEEPPNCAQKKPSKELENECDIESKIEMLQKLSPEERRRQKRKWKRRMREEALFVGGNKGLFERHLAELRDYEHQEDCRKLRHEIYGKQMTEKERMAEIVEALDKARLSKTKILFPKTEFEEPVEQMTNDLTTITVSRNAPVLVHVEFPGLVKNVNAAMECFGGLDKLSKSLDSAKQKLEIKLRPWDPSCKAAHGDGSTTCGILVKIRKRKTVTSTVPEVVEEPPLIELNRLGKKPNRKQMYKEYTEKKSKEAAAAEEEEEAQKSLLQQEKSWKPDRQKPYFTSTGVLITKELIINQDAIIAEKRDEQRKISRIHRNKDHEDKHCYLNLPNFKTFNPAKSEFEVEVIGLVSRQYKFLNSLCDIQFQPFKMFEGKSVCTAGRITDVFLNPDGRWPFFSELLHLGKRIPEFIVPHSFSRVYKYLQEFSIFENRKCTEESNSEGDSNNEEDDDDEKNATSVIGQRSGRPKRLVHTHLFDFKHTDGNLDPNVVQVPTKPFDRALIDIRRKGLKNQRDRVAKLFEERPIWTKFALENITKYDTNTLKYILPGVAYFTITSPWRSAWVRLSYDPRKDKEAYVYQMMDYRVPFVYRKYLGLSASGPVHNSSYRARTVPPKGQVFYQLCEINIPEVEELVINLGDKITSDEDLQYDPKWGWVPSETLEYVRYNITRHIELHLFELGKIPRVYSPALELQPGEVFPRDKIRFCHNAHNKRIRRKKPTNSSRSPYTSTTPSKTRKHVETEDMFERLPKPIYKSSEDALPNLSMRNTRHLMNEPAQSAYNPLDDDRHLFGNTKNKWATRNEKEDLRHLRKRTKTTSQSKPHK